MKIIFGIVFLLITIILIYILIRKILTLYTGWSQQDADEILQQKIVELYYKCTNTNPYYISTDTTFITEALDIYKSILGEKRYETLEKLARSNEIFKFKMEGDIPYLLCTTLDFNEQEKVMLENSLKSVLTKFLKAHGKSTIILSEWRTHDTLSLPILKIKYSETPKQGMILQSFIETENQKTLQQYKEVLDEEEDLYE